MLESTPKLNKAEKKLEWESSKRRLFSKNSRKGPQPQYSPVLAGYVKKWLKAGSTRYEISKRLDIDLTTLYRWAAEYPEFSEAMKLGDEAAVDRVELSVFEKAVGWQYKEKVVTKKMRGGKEVEEVVEIEKQMPPDIAAAQFILKNKRSHIWKDKHEITVNHNLNLMTSNDLEKLLAQYISVDYEEVKENPPLLEGTKESS